MAGQGEGDLAQLGKEVIDHALAQVEPATRHISKAAAAMLVTAGEALIEAAEETSQRATDEAAKPGGGGRKALVLAGTALAAGTVAWAVKKHPGVRARLGLGPQPDLDDGAADAPEGTPE